MLIWENPHAINQWVGSRGGGHCQPGTYSAIGYVEGGDLIGGLVFYHSNGSNCFVNLALSEKRFPRALLRAGLYYAFKQLTLKRLTFFISSGNIASQELVTRLGAKREATLRRADIGGGDLFLYSLFPEDCWIWSVFNEKRKCPGKPEPCGDDPPPGAGKPSDL